jgi:hypothetical protein
VKSFGTDLPKSVALVVEIKPPTVENVLIDEKSLVPIALLSGSARVEVK